MYIERLEKERPTCVTFLAETVTDSNKPRKIVVKFATRYGKDAHVHLAEKGCAPQLHYFGHLPNSQHLRMVAM